MKDMDVPDKEKHDPENAMELLFSRSPTNLRHQPGTKTP